MQAPPPPFAFDWPALAAEAQLAVQRRGDAFDKLVQHLGRDAADAEIRIWRAIAAEWHWAITHDLPADAPAAGHYERLDMLQRSLARCDRDLQKERRALPIDVQRELKTVTMDILSRLYGKQFQPFLDTHLRRDRVAALLWWQRRTGPDSLRFVVQTTIEFRRQLRGTENRRAA